MDTREKVCEKLDELVLRSLELMQEKILTTIQLENQLREGHIELAKSRYINGKESVGMLKVPQESSITSLFELETTLEESKLQSSDQNVIPHFDISLKKTDEDSEIQNPIKWFGVLVPQSLKTAQKKFQESLYLATKLANISAELVSIPSEINYLKKMKQELPTNVEE